VRYEQAIIAYSPTRRGTPKEYGLWAMSAGIKKPKHAVACFGRRIIKSKKFKFIFSQSAELYGLYHQKVQVCMYLKPVKTGLWAIY
jgi:hypothetical protein